MTINGEHVLAVVPARGGSKGIPRKNIRDLAGRPLIEWTLAEAARSQYVDRTIVSTDDQEIADVSRRAGGDVPFMRPAELAADDTPGLAPLVHACRSLPGYEWVILLQPTSPLRIAADIDACIEACAVDGQRRATTVVREQHGIHLLRTIDDSGHLRHALPGQAETNRRQDASEVFRLNGAVYVARVADVLAGQPLVDDQTFAVKMPATRSLDIDTPDDLALAEFLIGRAPR